MQTKLLKVVDQSVTCHYCTRAKIHLASSQKSPTVDHIVQLGRARLTMQLRKSKKKASEAKDIEWHNKNCTDAQFASWLRARFIDRCVRFFNKGAVLDSDPVSTIYIDCEETHPEDGFRLKNIALQGVRQDTQRSIPVPSLLILAGSWWRGIRLMTALIGRFDDRRKKTVHKRENVSRNAIDYRDAANRSHAVPIFPRFAHCRHC